MQTTEELALHPQAPIPKPPIEKTPESLHFEPTSGVFQSNSGARMRGTGCRGM